MAGMLSDHIRNEGVFTNVWRRPNRSSMNELHQPARIRDDAREGTCHLPCGSRWPISAAVPDGQ